MPAWQRVGAYGVALVVVLFAAIGVGRLVGPIEAGDDEHGDGHGAGHGAGHGDGTGHGAGHEGGYRLVLADDVLAAGRARVAFTVLDDAGEPVTSYDEQHEKELHLVAVRSDLAEYRHVHPALDRGTGRWSVPVALDAGSWRLYADFVPAGGEQTVLEGDLDVAGDYRPRELGPDRTVSRVDGYEVHLERDGSMVTAHVTRGGEDVTDLQPYLGAYGHLVAIRAADLAYLHVHPEDAGPGPEIPFHAELATAGSYRLFLDFRHGGRVHTADFTITIDGASGPDDTEHSEEESSGGHDH